MTDTPTGTVVDEPDEGEEVAADEPVEEEVATDEPPTGEATRVVVSYPADLSGWGRRQVATPHFLGYLRRTLGEVAVGDAWEEFVGVGCCGNTLDVPLRVERVEGGTRVGADTAIEYEVREACGIEGGWRVQSRDGPTQ